MSDCVYPLSCSHYGDKVSETNFSPLLDRIDIHIEVPRVDYEKLSGDRVSETSESIRARLQAAREIQLTRFSINASSDIICNADMRVGEIRQFCQLRAEGRNPMRSAMSQLQLSARTIADLAGSEEIQSEHLAKALQYRPKIMIG